MELFEALTKRRSCRDFTKDPVSRDAVGRLLYAASRAPTASNVSYRELILIDDARVVRAVRQIHPALIAESNCLIVVVTNLRMAIERVGRVGALSSLIDSGAAGENILLAAVDLGLGSQFTMISAMAGIRTILGLPDHYRVDLILPIGVPIQATPGVKGPRRTNPVHHNQFGVAYGLGD
jgi:nitroreductase